MNAALPTSAEVLEQINACREELAALKKLLRLVRSAEQATQARCRRERPALSLHREECCDA
jgi:hypothetical protein